MESRLDHEKGKFEDWLASDEYVAALTSRLKVNDACLRNKQARSLTWQLCKDDPVFFVEHFGWTYDPRKERAPGHLPFILFEYQKETIRWIVRHIESGEDALIDKSRDMGATWLVIWVFYWYWLFSDTFSGLMGSYKEDLVDNRTLDSLFGKLDYCVNNTPQWLLPARFSMKKHRQQMKLTNPVSSNLISGDTMNPDFARGARKTASFLDEGASWQYFREAWTAAADTTPCRITASTPKGKNAFWKLIENGIDRLTLHWSKHPIKDQKWYDFEKSRRTAEEVAQELDISYSASQEGRVYPEWDEVQWGEFPYEEQLPLYVSWDYGKSDDTAIIWWQSKGDQVRVIDAFSRNKKLIDWFIPLVTGAWPSDPEEYAAADLEVVRAHKGWKPAAHFGDPSGVQTNQVTNQSVLDVLRSHGISVRFLTDSQDFQKRKTAAKMVMRNLVVNRNERTQELGSAMEAAHYPMVRMGGDQYVRSTKPIHDWSSHFRSSFEYFAVNFRQRRSTNQRDQFPKKHRERQRVIGY